MRTFALNDDPARSAVFLLFNAALVQAAAARAGRRPNAVVIAGPEALLARFERLAVVRVEDGLVEAFAPTVDHPLANAPLVDVVLWRYEDGTHDEVAFRAGGVEERVRITANDRLGA